MNWYSEEVEHTAATDAEPRNISVTDQGFNFSSAMNSFIGPAHWSVTKILKVEQLNSSAMKLVKYWLKTHILHLTVFILYSTGVLVEGSEKGKMENIKIMFKL